MTAQTIMAGSCSPNRISIEEVLNRCLTELLKEPVQVIGEPDGFRRTCLREYCRFDTQARMPGDKFSYALNQRLPEDIRIRGSRGASHLSSQKDGQHKDV